MRIPDYISPIIGWRVWRWDASGLKSLNGEPWLPGKPLEARCRVSHNCISGGRVRAAASLPHRAPELKCTCGIYGSKSFDHLRRTQFWQYGAVHGEVSLWGSVVEHEAGFRAEFAYPKTLYLPSRILPITLKQVQIRIQSLIEYGCDLFIANNGSNLPLWRKSLGFEAAGLSFLMNRGREWYAQQASERRIKHGDRVAILGRGIAVVEQVDGKWIRTVLCNKRSLKIARVCILWNDQNVLWETSPQACVETNAKA